jgi:hypothetical protein
MSILTQKPNATSHTACYLRLPRILRFQLPRCPNGLSDKCTGDARLPAGCYADSECLLSSMVTHPWIRINISSSHSVHRLLDLHHEDQDPRSTLWSTCNAWSSVASRRTGLNGSDLGIYGYALPHPIGVHDDVLLRTVCHGTNVLDVCLRTIRETVSHLLLSVHLFNPPLSLARREGELMIGFFHSSVWCSLQIPSDQAILQKVWRADRSMIAFRIR